MVKHTVYTIDKPFTEMLRPNERLTPNEDAFSEAFGLRPSPQGALAAREIYDAFSAPVGGNPVWPWPQFVYDEHGQPAYATTGGHMYPLGGTTPPWTVGVAYPTWRLAAFNGQDPMTGDETTGIETPASRWRMARFGNLDVFSGGCGTLAWRWDGGWRVWHSRAPLINSVCNYRNRVVWGGISGWSQDWLTAWNALITKLPEGTAVEMPLGMNYVAWGGFGSGDVFLWHNPSGQVSGKWEGTYDESNPLFLRLLKRNQMGWVPMPYNAPVLLVEALGEGVIVYSSAGIHALLPVSGHTGFGVKQLSTVGVSRVEQIHTSAKAHVYVDNHNTVRRIREDLTVDTLGYRRHIETLKTEANTENLWVVHEPVTDEIYCATQNHSLLITPHGASRLRQSPLSLVHAKGKHYGIRTSHSNQTATIKVAPTTFGDMRTKVLYAIQVQGRNLDKVSASVGYRHSPQANWTWTTPAPVSARGILRPMVTGVEFQIHLIVTEYQLAELDAIHVGVQHGRESLSGVI